MNSINEDTFSIIRKYFNDGYEYKEIISLLIKRHEITISLRTLERLLQKHGLRRKNVENELVEIVAAIDMELEGSGRNLEYRMMKRKIWTEYGIRAKYTTVLEVLRILNPSGVERRSRYRLKRRIYSVLGPNFIWHIDGHDKLNRFGFCIHGAIDGYSKKIMWLCVSSSNKDPRVVAFYYLKTVEKYNCLPTLIRSDAGTENSIVENLHKALRYGQGDEFEGDKSFLIGKSVHNQRIESFWYRLRGLVAGFFINLFKKMEAKDVLDTNSRIDIEILRFCFGHLIQHDLNTAKKIWNLHRIRKQPCRDIPGGKPNVLYYLPENSNAKDCRKSVNQEHIQIFLYKYTTQPRLYRQGFADTVVEAVLPSCPIPCTAEEAYELFLDLFSRIKAIRSTETACSK